MEKMIMTQAMRDELELMQLILAYKDYSDIEKILAVKNVIDRILK